MAFLLDICGLVFIAAFVRALPTISPSVSLSTSTFFLAPTGIKYLTTSNGSSIASHAQTTYRGPLTPSSPWINGPPKGPWSAPLKHHRPPAQSLSSANTQDSSSAGFGPATTISSVSRQSLHSSHPGVTSGSYDINGSSITLGSGAGQLSSSGVFESPFTTSTGLPATSTQVIGSGSDFSLMAGQTIDMITLFHDRHGPGSTSLPTGIATVATSSLTLSSAGVLQASATAAVVPPLSTFSSATIIASLGTTTVAASSVTLPSTSATSASAATTTNDCGVVQAFYGQTAANWDAIDMDTWLNTWFSDYSSEIAANSYGFAGAFGSWAVGNPDFNCQDDGSNTDCDFDPCNIVALNTNPDVANAYYTMESINRLHTYFTGLSQSFEVSAIAAALSKDDWAETFYVDKDVKSVTALRLLFAFLQIIIGIGAALAGLGPAVGGAIASGGVALFGGATNAAIAAIATHEDDTFQKSADLGGILGNIVVGAMEGFTSANNELMEGNNYDGTGDIRSYFAGGGFVDFGGVDKNSVINAMNAFLIGQSINQLWRTQKIFIMGGGACGDGQGIGSGPANYSVCVNNVAWYLYWWQEDNVISVTSHQWGWVAAPPGASSLGTGDYAGVTVQDVILASVSAYQVAGYDYDNITAYNRVKSALEGQWANPGAQGPSWEGTFTIPVCDVSGAIEADYQDKQYILQPYNGDNSRPIWCGPICGGNLTTTQAFIAAAQMTNFDSPKHACTLSPGY